MSVINIIGTVGAGKTTLAKKLQEATNLPVGYESNSQQLSEETRDLLSKYYDNPEKYALEKNIFFLNQRSQTMQRSEEYPVYISDRFLYDDFLMALLNLKRGQMSQNEWDTYISEFNKVESKFYGKSVPNNDILIFIMPSFEQTLLQIKERGRKEEQIDENPELKQYYKEMYDLYIEVFSKWDVTPKIILNDVESTEIPTLIAQIKKAQPTFAELI